MRGSVHAASGHSSGRHLPPLAALLATLVFVTAVVCTPREQIWAFGAHALILLGCATLLRVPARRLVARVGLEVPFVVFALMLPFVGRGPDVEVAGVTLSRPGLWAAWAILVKGTLGVLASGLLLTSVSEVALVGALDRLRVPRVLTGTMSFMLRYGDVVVDEQRRMRIARTSRGDDPRWLWQAGTTARTLGALFVRSYERGERVQVAMASRGFTGTFPATVTGGSSPREHTGRLTAILVAWSGAVVAVCLTAVLA